MSDIGQFNANGQLLIGGTAAPHNKPANLTSSGGTVTITNGQNTINLESTGFPPTPGVQVTLVDDFIGQGGVSTNSISSSLTWFNNTNTDGFTQTDTTDKAHPGIVTINSSLGVGASANLYLGNNASGGILKTMILAGGAIQLNWVFNMVTLSAGSNTYILRMGLGDTLAAAQANGCYVEYTNTVNSAQWQFITASATTLTTSNSTVTVTTGWHNLQININAAATSVSFLMDGVSLGTAITTHIPTTAITPFVSVARTGGSVAAGSMTVDLFFLSQTLTAAR